MDCLIFRIWQMELDIGNPAKSIFDDGAMIRFSDATVFFLLIFWRGII